MPLPPHQVVHAAADVLAVKELFHFVLALLTRIRDRTGRRWFTIAGVVGLEAVHIHRRTAFEAARESQGVGVRPGEGDDAKGAVLPWPQLPDLRRVQQLFSPQQHAVANLEHRVNPTSIQVCLTLLLRRVKQSPDLLLQSFMREAYIAGDSPESRRSGSDKGRRGCAPRSMKNGVRSPPKVEAELLMAKTA